MALGAVSGAGGFIMELQLSQRRYPFHVKAQAQAQAQPSHVTLKDSVAENGAAATHSDNKPLWFRKEQKEQEDDLKKLIQSTKMKVLDMIASVLYKPQELANYYFQGNFSPVKEIGGWVPAKVIEGAVPEDFPAGTYIRNGPNPYLGGQNMQSPFGKFVFHWFEGDGMLHATRFDVGGKSISYQNKYVDTPGLLFEKKTDKLSYYTAVEGDPWALAFNYLFNMARFGKVNRATCNTNIFQLAGKLYAVAEADVPYEINLSDLSTVGSIDLEGWNRPFSAHPKLDSDTGELITFSVYPEQPYMELGFISKEGKLVRKVDLKMKRPVFIHEIALTKRYNIIPDFPLTIDVSRMFSGRRLVEFDKDSYSRIGVMARYGDADSVKWFDVKLGYSFHMINAYEDGDEVVLHALLSRSPALISCPRNVDKHEYFARGLTPTRPEDAKDLFIDGALSAHVHEWRFNLDRGSVMERDLTDLETCGVEMPKINSSYAGRKNRFAYAQVVDVNASRAVGMPKYGKMTKIHLPSSAQEGIKMEYHELGAHRYGSEPLFVPRPNAEAEDDGWIVCYVHDELTNVSEVYILDAQKFEDRPLARIKLPQRVPYGFHSEYFPA